MATNSTIKVNVDVNSNGTTAKETKQAEALAQQLKNVGNEAARASKGLSASKSTAAPSTLNKLKSATDPNSDLAEYRTARGLGGSTGAAGRDFAKQSQGLGGLVHVYATFAANVFAVSAAFTALRNAADTTNMIKGMNQLGASSGKALGSLSKEVANLTDGAISLSEAMTAVAQASAAGMSAENIKKMTVGAKNASAALGIGMSDALSRVTRGVSKLEPELLDEIGIFVRVDKAAQDYARTLGKSASSLTDMEKRAGFAKAVLDQLDEKFGSMDTTANPFSKLTAGLQNLLQTGLEFLNKFLGPLVKMLAESPTGLALAITGVVASLAKMAMPTLGNIKENAAQAAEAAKMLANTKSLSALKGNEILSNRIRSLDNAADDIVTKLDKLEDKAKNLFKGPAQAKKLELFALPPGDFDKEKTAELQKYINLAKDPARLEALQALKTNVAEYNQALLSLQSAEKSGIKLDEKALTTKQKLMGIFDAETRNRMLADKANQDSLARNISNNAVRIASEEGLGKALKQVWADVAKARKSGDTIKLDIPRMEKDGVTPKLDAAGKQLMFQVEKDVPKLGLFKAGITGVSAAFSALTTTLSSALNVLGIWSAVIAAVIAGFTIFAAWASNNAKEFDKFSSSLEGSEAATKTLADTLEKLGKKGAFTIEGLSARATAMDGLANATENLVDSYKKLQTANNWWDKFADGFWDMLGRGQADKLSTALSDTIVSGIEGIADERVRSEAQAKLQDIVGKGVNIKDRAAVDSALRKLDNAEVLQAGSAIQKVFKTASEEVKKTADDLVGLKEGLKEIAKLVQSQTNKLLLSDDQGRIGVAMLAQAASLNKALEDPIKSILVLKELVEDTNKLSLLPPDTAQELAKDSANIKRLAKEYDDFLSKKISGEKELAKLKADNKFDYELTGAGYDKTTGRKLRRETDEGTAAKNAVEANAARGRYLEEEMRKQSEKVSAQVKLDFTTVGLTKLTSSLSIAMQEGGITAGKAISSAMKSAGLGTANIDKSLRDQELGIQKQLLDAAYQQAKQLERNTLALEESTATARRSELTRNPDRITDENKKELDKIASTLADITKRRETLGKKPSEILAMSKGTNAQKDALAGSANFVSQTIGYMAANAKLGGQAAASEIQFQMDTISDIAAEEKGILTLKNKQNDSSISANALAIERLGYYDETLEKQRESLSKAKVENDLAAKKIESVAQLKKLEFLKGKPGVDEKKREEEVKLVKGGQVEDAKAASIELSKISDDVYNRAAANKEKLRVIDQGMLEQARKDSADTQASNLTIQQQQVDYLKTIGALKDEDAIRQTSAIALQQQTISYENQKAQILLDTANKLAPLKAAEARATALNVKVDPDVLKQIDAVTASKDAQLATATKLNDSSRESIALQSEHNQLIARHAEIMEDMVSLTATLAISFGKVGAGIGAGLTAIVKLGQNEENYLKKKLALQKKLESADDRDPEKAEAAIELGKIEKENTIQQLNAMGTIAGETKKMFSEKTGMYKALNAIEQANHAAAMVMQAEKMAQTLMALPKTLAGGISKLFEQGGWAGFAGAASLIAMVSSLVGGVGVSVPQAGTTAEDRQKVQGTGQSWSNGKIVDNGGGALGDATAVSTAIIDGIDTLSKIMFENLDFNKDKTYLALLAIKDNTMKFVKAITATSGITGGVSAFGTQEGTSKTFSGFSSKSVQVLDTGITLVGKLSELIAGGGIRQQYETTQTNKSSVWGLFKSSSTNTQDKKLQNATDAYITNIFKSFKDVLIMSAEALGGVNIEESSIFGLSKRVTTVTGDAMSAAIEKILDEAPIAVKTSGKGLTGQEFADAVMSEIGIQLDIVANTAFPQLKAISEAFQEFGETTTDFLVRIINTNKNVKLAFDSIGKLGYLRSELNLELTKFAGGLDNFVSQIQGFGDAFLTEAERLAPIQTAVTKEMNSLGFGMVTTREDFKQLVLGFKVVDTTSAETYARLLALSDSFDKVTQVTEKAMSAEEYLNAAREQSIAIMNLEGKTTEALNIERKYELSQLDKRLRSGQEYIWAMEDEAKIKDKLKAAYDKEVAEMEKVIDGLDSMIKTLKEFKTSLVTGPQSIAAPKDLYSSRKAEVDRLSTLAKSSDEKVRNDAISKLPAASNAFLESSKTLYASSQQYKTDFSYILDLVDSNINALDTQKTTGEYQLEALKAQGASLKLIEESTTSFADTLKLYEAAQLVTEQKRTTYYAESLAASTSITDAINTSASNRVSDIVKAILEAESIAANNRNIAAANPGLSSDNFWDAQQMGIPYTGPTTYTPPANDVITQQYGLYPDWWYAQNSASPGDTGGGNAIGGKASGIRMVGELGPELVDFSQPGRVYTAAQTAGMFSAANDATGGSSMTQAISRLTAEVKSLNKQVEQLRKEQNKQTGDIIMSNYDANQKAANTISDTVETTTTEMQWAERSKVKVA